ncbi:alpha/beta fold hydrolase [Leucobacter musarum]|uniref:alpha/beta fold hydrolase n=1 Tax=Leucobacter musarum TaxID=1930747 RepID=UPI0009E6C9E6|nr:alpha/beta fold hydrolase [Leucobacter musarum]
MLTPATPESVHSISVTNRHGGAATLRLIERGEGPAVLLLHGVPQNAHAWDPIAASLAADHRVLSVNIRGFGGSTVTRKGYDLDGLAEDVLMLLDARGVTHIRIIGHDLGAQVGFRLVQRAPDRVKALLALNMFHPRMLRRRYFLHAWRFWYTAFLEYPYVGEWVGRHCPAFTRSLLRYEAGSPNAWSEEELAEQSAAAAHSARAVQ